MGEIEWTHFQLLERIPPCLDWDVQQVCHWLHTIGMGQYEPCFRMNFITGRKLICLHASGLCRLGVKDFQDIKFICRELRKTLWIHSLDLDTEPCLRNYRLMYIHQKQRTGKKMDSLSFQQFKEEYKPAFDHTNGPDGGQLPRQDFLRRTPSCPWPLLKRRPKEERPKKKKRKGEKPKEKKATEDESMEEEPDEEKVTEENPEEGKTEMEKLEEEISKAEEQKEEISKEEEQKQKEQKEAKSKKEKANRVRTRKGKKKEVKPTEVIPMEVKPKTLWFRRLASHVSDCILCEDLKRIKDAALAKAKGLHPERREI